MRALTILLILLLPFNVRAAQGDKGRLTPTPDPGAASKVYVPKDLDDAFAELKKMLPPALLEEMGRRTEEEMILYHHGLGTWLRNNWGLWAGSRLARYFNGRGVEHPDDMSGIILTSFWRHIHSRPVELDAQVERYKAYWRGMEEKEEAVTPVSETALGRRLTTYDGQTVRLSDYLGRKVVVLAWWYMLCKPSDGDCRLLKQLVRLKREYGPRGVEVIGMPGVHPFDPAKEAARVKGITRLYGVNFPLVWDDNDFTHDVEEYDKFGYSSFPQVFVISADGHVFKRIRDFDDDELPKLLREAVEAALRRGDARK